MRLFGLLGYPLSHSFSAGYFENKFTSLGLTDCEYRNFEISEINKVKSVLSKSELTGLNITIPYKTEILDYVDDLTDSVRSIGAANTLKINDGKVKAYNTDYIGFRDSLRNLPFDQSKKVLILGSGGSSKAIQYALEELGLIFEIVSSSSKKDTISYQELNKKGLSEYSLIVNTTPLGMYPNSDSKPDIPYVELNENHFCYDLVYNPETTEFLREAALRNAAIKNGLEMLILQAEASWKIWSEVK